MITFSGVQMSPGSGNCPTPEDIAVAMCRVTRYAGALWVPLAAHSILAGELAHRTAHQSIKDVAFSAGLLHDAHETVTGEVTRHYKPPEMKPFEHELDGLIFQAFNIPIQGYRDFKDFFKAVDEKALTLEATLLGLKNWKSYYRRMEGKDVPAVTPEEMSLARDVISRWSDPSMVISDTPRPRALTKALQFVMDGHHSAARTLLLWTSFIEPT